MPIFASSSHAYLGNFTDARLMQENFVQVDGNKIRYLESGNSKNAMLLVHGLGASAERWLGVIPALAKHYRVIVPDLVGFGCSVKPPVDYTPAFFIDFLSKFFEAVGVKVSIVVGSSLGGQIAADFAFTHSDSVRKLILVSPAGMMKHSTPALDAYILAALFPNEQSAKTAFEMMEDSGKDVDEAIVKGFVKRMRMPNAKLAFMSTLLGLKNSEMLDKKLERILVPTLLIWGSNDPVIPIKYADSFVSSIPDCSLYKMKGCGHTPYVQKPEEFSAAALEFLLDD